MADRTFYLNINDGFLSTSNSLINQDIWKKTSNGLNIYYNKTNKNVNVGINNNNPTKTLDVTGDIQFSGDLYKNNELVDLTGGGGGGGSTVWTTSGTSIYYNTGNVGVNQISPSKKLDVGGDINLTGDIYFNGTKTGATKWILNGTLLYALDVNVGIKTNDPRKELDVSGSAIIRQNLEVNNDISTNNLFVVNDISINNNLYVINDVSINNNLFVSNDLSINKNLNVGQNIIAYKNVGIKNNLDICGNLDIYGNLTTHQLNVNYTNINSTNVTISDNIISIGYTDSSNIFDKGIVFNSIKDNSNQALLWKYDQSSFVLANVGDISGANPPLVISSINNYSDLRVGNLIAEGDISSNAKIKSVSLDSSNVNISNLTVFDTLTLGSTNIGNKITQIDTSINLLDSSASNLTTRVNTLDASFILLDLSASNLTTRVNTLDVSVNLLDSSASNLTTHVNTLDVSVNLLDSSASNLTTRVNTLDASFILLDTSASNLTTRVNTLDASFILLDTSASNLTTRVNTLDASFILLDSSASNLTTRVNTLDVSVNLLDTSASNLTTRVNTLDVSVNLLDTSASNLTTRVNTLDVSVNLLDTSASNLTTRVNTLDASFILLDTSASNLTTRVNTLDASFILLDTSASNLTTRVNTLDASFILLDTSASNLTTRVNTLDASFILLDTSASNLTINKQDLVTKDTDLSVNNLYVSNDISLNSGNLFLSGDISSNANLSVQGNNNIYGNTTIQGNIYSEGDVSFNSSNLFVSGDISNNGNLSVQGNINSQGDIYSEGQINTIDISCRSLHIENVLSNSRYMTLEDDFNRDIASFTGKLISGTNADAVDLSMVSYSGSESKEILLSTDPDTPSYIDVSFVGIGTKTPTEKFEVTGNIKGSDLFITNGFCDTSFCIGSSPHKEFQFEVKGGSNFAVNTQDSEYVECGNLKSSGDVLDLVSFGNVEIICDANGNSSGKSIKFMSNGRLGNGNNLMKIEEDGVVKIGDFESNSDMLLSLNGDAGRNGVLQIVSRSDGGSKEIDGIAFKPTNNGNNIINFQNTSGSDRAQIKGNGGSAVQYQTGSDRRLKTNIVDMSSQLQNIMDLQPRKYNWISDNVEGYGFIAQEVHNIYPELRDNFEETYCSNNPDFHADCPCDASGKMFYYGLDYGTFTPYIIKAFQEYKIKTDISLNNLESRLSALVSQLETT